MQSNKPFIVGLGGGSGSGKTTLTKIIASALPWETTIISLDQFYHDLSHLSQDDREQVNFDHPDSIDVPAALTAIGQLKQCKTAEIPVYDFTQHNRSGFTATIFPTSVIIIEGMYTLHNLDLLELCDLTIFLNISERLRWQRKLDRDIRERNRTFESVLKMWMNHTKPMHNQFVQPTSSRANLLFHDSFAPEVIAAITKTIQQKVGLMYNATNYVPA